MPKNYQITQYDKPSTANGLVEFEFNGGLARVRITRAHLEEDVGKSTHFERNSAWISNRAGVPLNGNRFRAGPHQCRHGVRISQRAQDILVMAA